jgi:signal transduction histidine kinase
VAGSGRTEVRYRTVDGAYVSIEVSISRLAEFEGAPALLGIVRDITERKRLHAQMLMTDRLASIGALAAGAAHEINNPLAAVVTNLGMAIKLLASMPPAEPISRVLECLGDASEAAARVRVIAGDLKVLSRVDDRVHEAVSLRSVLDSSVRMAKSEIRARAVLRQDYGSLPRVIGAEVRLGQVFLNLLINAAQATAALRVTTRSACPRACCATTRSQSR